MIISELAELICPTWETLFPSEKSVVMYGIKNFPETIFEYLVEIDEKENLKNEYSK